MKYSWSILFVYFITLYNLEAQQYASMVLSTVAGDNFINANDESMFYEGYLKEDTLLLKENNAGQNVEFNINIENTIDAADDYTLFLVNPTGPDYFGYQITGGGIEIQDNYGSFVLTSNPGSGYLLDIIRCDSTIFYVHENKIIFCREISGNGFQLNGQVGVEEAIGANVDVAIHIPEDCDFICGKIREQYLVLEEFVNWREHVMNDSILKFKYVEKYSIPDDNNNIIHCYLLDNHDHVLYSEDLDNKYGINLQEWKIPHSYLSTGENYVFRTVGMNKGKVYNVRIRYDGD